MNLLRRVHAKQAKNITNHVLCVLYQYHLKKKHEIQTFKSRVFFSSENGITYITNMICDMFCLFCVHAPLYKDKTQRLPHR